MGMNFPNSPIPGQVYTPVGGYSYVFLDGVWRLVQPAQAYVPTADTRNRIVNPAFTISQENPAAGGSTNNYYPADQWALRIGTLTGQVTAYQLYSATYTPSRWRVRLQTNIAQPSLAAATWVGLLQSLEGANLSDFNWGIGSAKPAVLRFDAYSLQGGTFAVSIRDNPASPTMSYVALFTVPAAGAGAVVTIPIPGPTTGAWTIDNTVSAAIGFIFAAGTTYQTPTEKVWTAGNLLATPAISNGLAAVNNDLHIANVGLYLDPAGTGVPPRFQAPDDAEELRACQRYCVVYNAVGAGPRLFTGITGNTTIATFTAQLPAPMRVVPALTAPAMTVVTAGTTTATVNVSSFDPPTMLSQSGALQFSANYTAGVIGAAQLRFGAAGNFMFNARM